MKRAIQWTGYALIGFVSMTIYAVPVGAQMTSLPPSTIQVAASDGAYTDRIAVCWTAVEGATSYEVYRSTFINHMYIPIAVSSACSLSDERIQASQYYYYKVRACQGTDCGPFSEPDVGSWKMGAPQGAFATRGRFADKIRVEWRRVENATLYYVYRSDEPERLDALLYMGYEPFLDDFGALAGKTYYYHVRALTTSTGSALTDSLPGYRDATLRVLSRYWALTEDDSAHCDEDTHFCLVPSAADGL